MPAGPVPTTAIRSGAKSDGSERGKEGSPQVWKLGEATAGPGSRSA